MPLDVRRCPWCGEDHSGALVLCDECEADAVRYRQQNGLSVRRAKILLDGEEPDD